MSAESGHPGELDDPEEDARVDRILELHAIAEKTPDEIAELMRLEDEQVAVEAARTGPA